MDDAVGQILDAIKQSGFEENTIVFFTSDHGSHIDIGTNGGSNRPFKGKLLTCFFSLCACV